MSDTRSTNQTREGIEVKAGQVWRDLDKRMKGRTVTVLAVAHDFAMVKGAKKITRLAVARMHRHSTGWELAQDSQPKEGE